MRKMTGLAVRFVGLRRGARGAWGWGSLILMIIKYRRAPRRHAHFF